MKTAAIIIPLILSQTCFAGITHIEDHRSANLILGIYGGPDTPPLGEDTIIEYNDFNQVLNQSFESFISAPELGITSAIISYESSISTTMFYSSVTAAATATTLEGGSIAWANTAFGNRVTFILDDTTTFQIAGFISGSGNIGGTHIVFGSVVDEGATSETFFSTSEFNNIQTLDASLTLEAGEYYFTALSFASATVAENNRSEFALAAHEITITVIPAPASSVLLLLAASALAARRRR